MGTKAYDNLEKIVTEKVMALQRENAQLRHDLDVAQAKLSVYERLATISDEKISLGFGPPLE